MQVSTVFKQKSTSLLSASLLSPPSLPASSHCPPLPSAHVASLCYEMEVCGVSAWCGA